jgi:hypothetical protein
MEKELIKKILNQNNDLPQRMQNEDWEVFYDKKSDMLFLNGSITDQSSLQYVGDEGFMLRVDDETNRISGFAIENFKKFSKQHEGFALVYLRFTHPFLFLAFALFAYLIFITFKKTTQFNEFLDYISKAATFGDARHGRLRAS